MIFLDTSYLIGAMILGSPEDVRLREWLSSGQELGVSVIAWAEFLCGPITPESARLAATLFPSPEPCSSVDAARAAELFNLAGRRRGSLPDCLIAATCLRLGGELATNNVTDFRRFEPAGLRLVIM